AVLAHPAPQAVDDGAALDDVVVDPFAAEIKKSVSKPDVLGIFLLPENGHRQLGSGAEHFNFGREDLDLAGRQLRILRSGRTRASLAVDADDPFGAELLRGLERRRIRIGYDLCQPVVIAQVNEQDAAVVADAVAPAGKAHHLAKVRLAERAASMGP